MISRFSAIRISLPLIFSALAVAGVSQVADAQTYFTSQSAFSSAAGGASALTVFNFEGSTETQGKTANDPTILPSYSSQGVDFLPFLNTNIYPTIFRNQQFQISVPGQDGLLTNDAATAPTTDLAARAIRFQFNRPETTVGFYFNGPYNTGDGGYLQAFDGAGNLIGQTPVSTAGGFVGLVSSTSIVRVNIVNTFDNDIRFGIFNLQFSNVTPSTVPEPGSVALLVGLTTVGANLLRKRRARK